MSTTGTTVKPYTGDLLDFRVLKETIQHRFDVMKKHPLFEVAVDREFIWTLYLESFPEGTNPKFRERTEYDCSACRSFVKNAGGIVNIIDGKLHTIWDVQVGGQFQPVLDNLSEYIRTTRIQNIFLDTEKGIGTERNYENSASGVLTWNHFHIDLPKEVVVAPAHVGPRLAEAHAMYDVALRSLREITSDAIDVVQDLIRQGSLYRGEEKAKLVEAFRKIKDEFPVLGNRDQELYAWSMVLGPNSWVCKIRNDVIGTLLTDISEGRDLAASVKSFEDKVSGTNYQRPTALITGRMRDAAKKTIEGLGFMDALDRRYAKLEDISVRNVLFADRSSRKRMSDNVFDDLPTKVSVARSLDKVESIPIAKFIEEILPTASSIEVLFEPQHTSNLVSLIAPVNPNSKSMFKWSNPFSWTYSGDVADSVKEKVKAAGGQVLGDVGCRLAWFNYDDLDLHMHEPKGGNHIHFRNKGPSVNGGRLDVDMNAGGGNTRVPVENIFYQSYRTMQPGTYTLSVHQYAKRESTNVGFEVEIEVLGQIHQFSYDKAVTHGQTIQIAELIPNREGVVVKPILQSKPIQKEVWGIQTQTFQKVTAIMLSPNFWDGQEVGNKHFFFMLADCVNDGTARGFYNEFLNRDLEPHRKTMEIVGSKVRTEETQDQMSGLGFSSTQRNSIVVKVKSSFERTLRVEF